MAAISTIVGLGISAFGAYQKKKAMDDQKKAIEEQNRLAAQQAAEARKQAEFEKRRVELVNQRNRRAALRESRVAQARVANQGALSGALGGSGFAGGMGSLQTQTAANVTFAGQQEQLGSSIFQSEGTQASFAAAAGQARGRETLAGANASMWGEVQSTGGQIFNATGGYQRVFKSLGIA